ncbi:MAG: M48 family metallopeptidase [Lautropia sp.]
MPPASARAAARTPARAPERSSEPVLAPVLAPVLTPVLAPVLALMAALVLALVPGAALPSPGAVATPAGGFALARTDPSEDDAGVGRKSRALSWVSAEKIERESAQQYSALMREAARKGALAPPSAPRLQRLRAIALRLVAQAPRYNARASDWAWEVNLIASEQVNAFCMPGGKIAFFDGIVTKLKLTDDEIAIVMGHEIAHALREHGRERAGKERWARVGTAIAAIGGALLGLGDLGGQVASGTATVVLLRNSRSDETEADAVGLDLAARAGFDPRAGIVVWRKMAAAASRQPPQWLSTHPSHKNRIRDIAAKLERVMPLYAEAIGKPLRRLEPYRSNVGEPIPWPPKGRAG